MKYGYGRVSTAGQSRDGNSLESQQEKLSQAGCGEIVLEAYTGKTMDRPKFCALMEKMTAGDTLVVCKLDRFARTAREGLEVVEQLMARGIAVHILNMGLIEDTPMGRMVLTVMLAFAQFERDSIVERTRDGKAIARRRPDYREGRKEKRPENFEEVYIRQQRGELSVAQALEECGVGRTRWYELVRERRGAGWS